MSETLPTKAITKLFKKWIVRRPHGMCQILFALTELDDFVDEILVVAHQHESATCMDNRMADFVRANSEVGQRCADLEIDLVNAGKRIAELEQRLPLDSAAGLGNEFRAWDAASDEALSRFEEEIEEG